MSNRNQTQNSDWLLQFKKPSERVMNELRQLIQSLPTGNQKLPQNLQKRQDDAMLVSGMDELIKLLAASLTEDFAETSEEAKSAPWVFDYVVFLESNSKSALYVMTRLHHPVEPGNIFYGRTVFKIGSKDFLLWMN